MNRLTLPLALALALVACGGEPEPAMPVAPPVAVFTATEYAFTGPDTLTAGPTVFRMESAGAEMHHLTLVRLDEGHTLEELMGAMGPGPLPAWAHLMGGPNPPAPGAASEATVVLTPGAWVMVCLIPAPDGMPHIAKGMVKAFTVVPGGAPAAEPAAQIVMTLRDYDFDFSTPLTAGTHTLRVENTAAQPHEIFLARLNEGKTLDDLVTWLGQMEAGAVEGPPPALPLGGVAGMDPGERNWFTVELTPGEYALLCFVPDVGDGRPHLAHGMMRQLTVQ